MTLGNRQIDVWVVPLDVSPVVIRRREALLSSDERTRASRFRFDRDRGRFIACRGRLREILGAYIAVAPSRLEIGCTAKGKPFLVNGPLQFNVAHSDDMALVACCAAEAVGVDVERVREFPDAGDVVRQFFAPQEIAEWTQLAEAQRTRAFFDCWTRKEAYVKAVGDGLSLPLDSFHVRFSPGEPAGLAVEGHPQPWSMFDVSPAPDYAGALAVRGAGWQVQLWRSEER